MTAVQIILLTKEKKANELGISTRTLDRWLKSGKIEFIQITNSKRKWFLPKI